VELLPSPRFGRRQHAVEHGVEVNDLRTASREPIQAGIGRFQYRLPDGRIWMGAVKS
jgi:hypothetical protein